MLTQRNNPGLADGINSTFYIQATSHVKQTILYSTCRMQNDVGWCVDCREESKIQNQSPEREFLTQIIPFSSQLYNRVTFNFYDSLIHYKIEFQ